jgi:hypothetical protein
MSNIARQESALKKRLVVLRKEMGKVEGELVQLQQVKSGDKPSPDQAKRMKVARSFGVHFQRRKALRKVKSPGEVCKSVRRFGTREEANQHGKRFTRIHKHKGFKVIVLSQRPNAWINWRTGKTNPVLNK